MEELQKKLKERHLKISGTKPELIERLKQADSSNSYIESTDTTGPPNVKKPKNDPGVVLSSCIVWWYNWEDKGKEYTQYTHYYCTYMFPWLNVTPSIIAVLE